MLVAQTKNLIEQLEQLNRQEVKGREATSIENTNIALKGLKSEINSLKGLYALLHDQLAPVVVESSLANAARLSKDLKNSRQGFIEDEIYNQANVVNKIANQVKQQRERLQQNWQSQVNRNVERFNNLWNLVRLIPEMKSNKQQIQNLLDQLKEYQTRFPQSGMDLQFYFQLVTSLDEQLTGAEGLSPKIKNFLEKLSQNKITFADIDEEIFGWCKDKKRAKTFQISFVE